jgi:hypothetical protein
VSLLLKDAYLEVCERSLEAADASSSAGIHEKACFLAYHAFESVGGALAASKKVKYPNAHQGKINQFMRLAKATPHRYAVGRLAIQLSSLRNLCLYPVKQADGSARSPSSSISKSNAAKLLKEVRGVVTRVRKYV